MGELAVHPGARGSGVGAALLEAVESAWPGVPVFAIGFRDARGFFYPQGYTQPPRPMEVLTKFDTWPVGDAITLEAGEG